MLPLYDLGLPPEAFGKSSGVGRRGSRVYLVAGAGLKRAVGGPLGLRGLCGKSSGLQSKAAAELVALNDIVLSWLVLPSIKRNCYILRDKLRPR